MMLGIRKYKKLRILPRYPRGFGWHRALSPSLSGAGHLPGATTRMTHAAASPKCGFPCLSANGRGMRRPLQAGSHSKGEPLQSGAGRFKAHLLGIRSPQRKVALVQRERHPSSSVDCTAEGASAGTNFGLTVHVSKTSQKSRPTYRSRKLAKLRKLCARFPAEDMPISVSLRGGNRANVGSSRQISPAATAPKLVAKSRR